MLILNVLNAWETFLIICLLLHSWFNQYSLPLISLIFFFQDILVSKHLFIIIKRNTLFMVHKYCTQPIKKCEDKPRKLLNFSWNFFFFVIKKLSLIQSLKIYYDINLVYIQYIQQESKKKKIRRQNLSALFVVFFISLKSKDTRFSIHKIQWIRKFTHYRIPY